MKECIPRFASRCWSQSEAPELAPSAGCKLWWTRVTCSWQHNSGTRQATHTKRNNPTKHVSSQSHCNVTRPSCNKQSDLPCALCTIRMHFADMIRFGNVVVSMNWAGMNASYFSSAKKKYTNLRFQILVTFDHFICFKIFDASYSPKYKFLFCPYKNIIRML